VSASADRDLGGRLRRRRRISSGTRTRLTVVEDACRDGLRLLWKVRRIRSRDPRPLEREFAATVTSRHPNLVKAVEMGGGTRLRWILREYVSGTALTDPDERVEPERIASVLQDVAEALADLHERGWCHGAVRPEHVIAHVRPGGEIRSRLIVTGDVRRIGDPARPARLEDLAPEDLAGLPSTPFLDQYGLGGLAYRLLTGRRPAAGRRPQAPSRSRPDVTPEVDQVVMRLLSRDPQDRYGCIREAAAVLRHALEGGSGSVPRGLRAAFRAEDWIRPEGLDWLDEVVRRGMGPVAIWGPAGVGKRAHLRRLGARLQREGVIWIRVAPTSAGDTTEQAIRNLARRLSFELRCVGLDERADDMAMRGGDSAGESSPASEISRAICELGARRTVVVCFEGLDRWDATGALLVRELMVEGRKMPVSILTADAAQGQFAGLLESASERVPTHELEPLSRDEVEDRLLARIRPDTVPALAVAAIHERTGGLPELIAHSLGDLAVSGRLSPDREGWSLGPQVDPMVMRGEPLQDFVSRRLDGLAAEARRTLECLSVLREPGLPRRVLDRALGRNWDRGLEDLIESGLAAVEDGRIRFFEAETPRAVYDALPDERRRSLNAALARALEGDGRGGRFPKAYAFHLRESGQVARAIYATLQAAESLESRDQLAAAASEYEALLLLLEGDRNHPLRRDAMERLLAVSLRLGEMSRCETLYVRLLQLAEESGDLDQRARLSLDLADHLITVRQFDRCREFVEEVAREPGLAAHEQAIRAKLSLFTTDLPAAEVHVARAERLIVPGTPSDLATVMVRCVQGILTATAGDYSRAIRLFRDAIAYAKRKDAVLWLASSIFNLAEVCQLRRMRWSARRLLRLKLGLDEGRSSPIKIYKTSERLAIFAQLRGDTRESAFYRAIARRHSCGSPSVTREYIRMRAIDRAWPWRLRSGIEGLPSESFSDALVKRDMDLKVAALQLGAGLVARATRLFEKLLESGEPRLKEIAAAHLAALGCLCPRRVPPLAGVRRSEFTLLTHVLRCQGELDPCLQRGGQHVSGPPSHWLGRVCAGQDDIGRRAPLMTARGNLTTLILWAVWGTRQSWCTVPSQHLSHRLGLRSADEVANRGGPLGRRLAATLIEDATGVAGGRLSERLLDLKSTIERSLDDTELGGPSLVPSATMIAADSSRPSGVLGRLEVEGLPREPGRLRRLLRRAVRNRLPLVISGETGTGKSHLCERLEVRHRYLLDCGLLSPEMMEVELFGCVKGAYTGAHDAREGLLRRAHGGYLILDHLEELDVACQAKLLRVLECGEIHPIGGRPLPCRFSTIVVTCSRLRDLVAQGRVRADFAQRVGGLRIRIKPLRRCRGEIRHLMRAFLLEEGKQGVRILPGGLKALSAHDWPGNVRELRNLARRVALLDRREELGEALVARMLPGTVPSGAVAGSDEGALVRIIARDGPLAAGEVAARVDVPLRTVQRHLRDLVRADVIVALGRGRSRVYGSHHDRSG
jgi:tetratricopeptide (TPR) repeat protein/DNA-binding transcriptional ArsR family regulator